METRLANYNFFSLLCFNVNLMECKEKKSNKIKKLKNLWENTDTYYMASAIHKKKIFQLQAVLVSEKEKYRS